MKHRWAVLCERFSIDQRSNNVTLFGVIDELHVQKSSLDQALAAGRPTAVQIQAVLVVQTERSDLEQPERGAVECRLFDAKGAELGNSRIEVSLDERRRVRSAFNINVLPITSEGLYVYQVFHVSEGNTQQVGEVPLYVRFDAPAT